MRLCRDLYITIMNTIVRYRDAILLFLPFSPYNTTCLATDTANDNTRVLILTAHLDDQCVLFSHLATSVCKRNNGDDLGLFADRGVQLWGSWCTAGINRSSLPQCPKVDFMWGSRGAAWNGKMIGKVISPYIDDNNIGFLFPLV